MGLLRWFKLKRAHRLERREADEESGRTYASLMKHADVATQAHARELFRQRGLAAAARYLASQ